MAFCPDLVVASSVPLAPFLRSNEACELDPNGERRVSSDDSSTSLTALVSHLHKLPDCPETGEETLPRSRSQQVAELSSQRKPDSQ